jgi:hypothetical protein
MTAMCGVAEQDVEATEATELRTASDITDATGNAFDAGGRSLSWDLVLDGLERTDIAFADDDQPTRGKS